jgi:hypothetical protein
MPSNIIFPPPDEQQVNKVAKDYEFTNTLEASAILNRYLRLAPFALNGRLDTCWSSSSSPDILIFAL